MSSLLTSQAVDLAGAAHLQGALPIRIGRERCPISQFEGSSRAPEPGDLRGEKTDEGEKSRGRLSSRIRAPAQPRRVEPVGLAETHYERIGEVIVIYSMRRSPGRQRKVETHPPFRPRCETQLESCQRNTSQLRHQRRRNRHLTLRGRSPAHHRWGGRL